MDFLRRQWPKWRYGFWQYWMWMAYLAFCMSLYLLDHPSVPVALAHAHTLSRAEQSLHLDPETHLQRWAISLGVEHFLGVVYALAQSLVWWLVLLELYIYAPTAYRTVRNTLLPFWLIAQLAFWLWPVAPPLLAHVASLQRFDIPSGQHVIYDDLAAMPSLHVGFALVVGCGLVAGLPKRWGRWRLLALTWPLLVILSVMASGNHYFFDVLATTGLAGICYLSCGGGWQRVRRWWRSRVDQHPSADVIPELVSAFADGE
jgi:membrane-associated phospholipid phosphatase